MDFDYKLGQTFKTFEEFSLDFKLKSDKNFCNWSTFGSGKRADDKSKYKYMHYKCVFSGDPDQIPTKSQGVRPIQKYNACGCKCEIKLVYKVKANTYEITRLHLSHDSESSQEKQCHDTDEVTFKSHPSNRRLQQADADIALRMMKTGSDAKKVFILKIFLYV